MTLPDVDIVLAQVQVEGRYIGRAGICSRSVKSFRYPRMSLSQCGDVLGMQNGGQTSLVHVMSVHVARMNLSVSADVPFVVTLWQSPEGRHALGVLQHMLNVEFGSHGTSSLGEPFG